MTLVQSSESGEDGDAWPALPQSPPHPTVSKARGVREAVTAQRSLSRRDHVWDPGGSEWKGTSGDSQGTRRSV